MDKSLGLLIYCGEVIRDNREDFSFQWNFLKKAIKDEWMELRDNRRRKVVEER